MPNKRSLRTYVSDDTKLLFVTMIHPEIYALYICLTFLEARYLFFLCMQRLKETVHLPQHVILSEIVVL